MHSGESYEDLSARDGLVGRRARVPSESDTMDSKSIDLSREVEQMERDINYYKSKLQSCRERYENMAMEICNVRRLQHNTLSELHCARAEEQNLQERFERIHLDHEACVEKSGGYEDLDEKVNATISELTAQRNTLMQELMQLKRNTEDNCRKLGRVNAMITEQEEKNEALLQELIRKSEENSFIPQDTRRRINALLEHLKRDDKDNATANDTME